MVLTVSVCISICLYLYPFCTCICPSIFVYLLQIKIRFWISFLQDHNLDQFLSSTAVFMNHYVRPSKRLSSTLRLQLLIQKISIAQKILQNTNCWYIKKTTLKLLTMSVCLSQLTLVCFYRL